MKGIWNNASTKILPGEICFFDSIFFFTKKKQMFENFGFSHVLKFENHYYIWLYLLFSFWVFSCYLSHAGQKKDHRQDRQDYQCYQLTFLQHHQINLLQENLHANCCHFLPIFGADSCKIQHQMHWKEIKQVY